MLHSAAAVSVRHKRSIRNGSLLLVWQISFVSAEHDMAMGSTTTECAHVQSRHGGGDELMRIQVQAIVCTNQACTVSRIRYLFVALSQISSL